MKTNRHPKLFLTLLVLLAALAMPGRVGADSLPTVTLGGRYFPGEFPSGTVHGCQFRLQFDNFAAGQEASVAFRVVPPTSARRGGDTVLSETFVLDGRSRTASYDLRHPLWERFEAGGPAGWDVELAVHVTDSGRPVFTGVARVLVGDDCMAGTTTTTTTSTTTTVPCGDCAGEPPRATLAGAGGQVTGVQGSFCWSGGAGRPAACQDSFFADPSDVLTVTPGETLALRFATTETPSELALYRYGTFDLRQPLLAGARADLVATNPSSLRAAFPAGTSWLVVSSRWKQGSSISFFKVLVKPEPVPTARPAVAKVAAIALTG